MRYKISCVSFWLDEKRKTKYEKYGLKFTPTSPEYANYGEWTREEDDEDAGGVYIEIKNLADIRSLIKDVGRIVLDNNSIEIYDDYRE